MSQSAAFLEGREHALSGYSVHYNPYRNIGIEKSSERSDWEDGWVSCQAVKQNV